MDETRTVLLGEGEGYKFHGQKNCVSSLTVKLQSGHNRRYTCQLVDEKNNVGTEADYTPVLTGDDQSDTPGPGKITCSRYKAQPDTLSKFYMLKMKYFHRRNICNFIVILSCRG